MHVVPYSRNVTAFIVDVHVRTRKCVGYLFSAHISCPWGILLMHTFEMGRLSDCAQVTGERDTGNVA